MKFRSILLSGVIVVLPCIASEQELFITTEFVLKTGASERRTLTIRKPKHMEQLVMIGFNPIKALSVDCVLRLYAPSDVLLGTYNCSEQQSHVFKQPVPATAFRAQIEVSNNNFTTVSSTFSVMNRFKFVDLTK